MIESQSPSDHGRTRSCITPCYRALIMGALDQLSKAVRIDFYGGFGLVFTSLGINVFYAFVLLNLSFKLTVWFPTNFWGYKIDLMFKIVSWPDSCLVSYSNL